MIMAVLKKIPSHHWFSLRSNRLTLVLVTSSSPSLLVLPTPQLPVVLVTTPFVVTASNLQTASTIAGGAGNDSVSFAGDLSGGMSLVVLDNDTLNFSAGVNNGAMFQW